MNYKSVAFRSPTILNLATSSSTMNRNSSHFLTWYPVPGGHLGKIARIVIQWLLSIIVAYLWIILTENR